MNLEDFKTYKEYADRAASILGRRVDPLGTEFDILKDVVAEVQQVQLADGTIIKFPGMQRAWNIGLISGAVAYFRDKVKKDIMPIQYAKDDNLIIEPIYRPQIFNMNSFNVSWSNITPPGTIDFFAPGGNAGAYNLQQDKELIIITDLVFVTPNPDVTEILATVDGETQRPLSVRKNNRFPGSIQVYDLPFPLIADINIRLQGRVESASGSLEYIPIGIHVVLGSIHAKSLT